MNTDCADGVVCRMLCIGDAAEGRVVCVDRGIGEEGRVAVGRQGHRRYDH